MTQDEWNTYLARAPERPTGEDCAVDPVGGAKVERSTRDPLSASSSSPGDPEAPGGAAPHPQHGEDLQQAARILREWAGDRQRIQGQWTRREQVAIDLAIRLEQAATVDSYTRPTDTLSDVQKLFVLLSEIRQCINDDNLMAAQRKVISVETILHAAAAVSRLPPQLKENKEDKVARVDVKSDIDGQDLAQRHNELTVNALDVAVADVVACFTKWDATIELALDTDTIDALHGLVAEWKRHRAGQRAARLTRPPAPQREEESPMTKSALEQFREAYRASRDLRVEIWGCLNRMENHPGFEDRRRSREHLEAIFGAVCLDREPPPPARLLELASRAAHEAHDFYFEGSTTMLPPKDKEGHERQFDRCPHADCTLIRDAEVAPAPAPAWQPDKEK